MTQIKKNQDTVLILQDIRSAHNVGAIFRTADAVGVSHIYLIGYTPAPLDRFGKKRNDIAKASLGAESSVSWSHHKTINPIISKLKKEGYVIIALEQDNNSTPYSKIKTKKFALIVGNEVDGVSRSALKKCDVIAEIPMRGEKESLNVSVALGIALYRLLNI